MERGIKSARVPLDEEEKVSADSVAAFALRVFYHEVAALPFSSHTVCSLHNFPLCFTL